MADELDAIRAQRLAQMQGGGGGGGGQGGEEKQQKMQDAKQSMLAAILSQGARTRLNNMAMVKPEKAAMVESMLISMYQSRQLQGQVDEEQLKAMLERVSDQQQKKTTIHFRRRDDDDDDD